MKKNPHYIILVAGTILFLLLTFLLIHSPMIPAQFAGPGMDIKIYERISEVLMGSMENGYIISVAVKIFFGYFAFVLLVFGHYYFTRSNEKS